MARVGGNRTPRVIPKEQEDFDKLMKCLFPWMLVLDEEEIENHRPKAILTNANSPVVVSIDPDFQIGAPN